MPTDVLAETLTAGESATSERLVLGSRYELRALLGAGGMGNVYKAFDRELEEFVALKVLRPEIAGAPGALERFRREVKLARRVTHPNVARVFDIGEQSGERFLTMELVEGESLSALVERERALPIHRILAIASAICAAVGAAHGAGVVHRDLKPDNVLLASDGRVVVTDFGIARAVAGGDAGKTFGGLVGTPAYMAPEQLEAGATIDERADVYALGEILYEMLTGARAWQGDSPIAVAAARLVKPPPDPAAIRMGLDPRLSLLTVRCMAQKPADRVQSMANVANELATIPPPAAPSSRGPAAPLAASSGVVTPQAAVPDGARQTSKKRVAVLPFRNLGPTEHEYIADGLTEDLIDLLTMGSGLHVCSRGVVMGYKGVDRDARRVGRELDVQVVIEGSVRRTPGSVRISARVVSVADGFQLWARRFDGDEAQLLVLNEQVAQAVAEALTAELDAPKRAAADDVDAIDLYLRARDAYHRFIERGAEGAISVFEAALARFPDDPRIVSGYVLARSRVLPDAETASVLRAEAERALRLGPSLPDAHVALGAVLFHANDPAAAVGPLERALRLAPHHAEAHDLLGRLLDEADLDDGARHLEAALAVAPGLGLARLALARHYCLRRDWDRAYAIHDAAEETPMTLPMRARAALWRRDTERAKEMLGGLETGLVHEWALGTVRALLTCAAFGTPVPDGALTPRNAGSPRTRGFAAQITAECAGAVGDADRTLAALEAADATELFDLSWVDRCPPLDCVRGSSRFLAVRAHVAERAARVAAARRAPAPGRAVTP